MTARAASVALLAATVALLPARSPGCAVVQPAGRWAGTAGEVAVLIWDQEAGVEHFTRAALFHGSAADFGFLVPTPSRPTLSDAPGPIAARLEQLTAPRTVTRQRLGSLGCFPQKATTFTTVGAVLPPRRRCRWWSRSGSATWTRPC